MRKNEFLEDLRVFCEFEGSNISLDTELRSIEGFDSLAIMSMIAFVHDNFGINVTAKQISELSDFNSLIDLIGEEKFEDD